MGEMDSVFLYVNSTFAPALDEVVGNLHRVSERFTSISIGERRGGRIGAFTDVWVKCFKDSKDQLIVSYSMTPAFG